MPQLSDRQRANLEARLEEIDDDHEHEEEASKILRILTYDVLEQLDRKFSPDQEQTPQ